MTALCSCGCGQEVKNNGSVWLKGHCNRGVIHSEEWKLRESQAKLGKPNTALIGRKLSMEHRKAISDALKGRHLSESHKEAISEGNKGRVFSVETIEKSKLARLGKKRSLEAKKNISRGHLGQKACNKGLQMSEETKKKLSESLKKSPNMPRGVNHHNWNGGSSKGYKQGNYNNNGDYKVWRGAIYQRDNYTCQSCGKERTYLTAHHIKSWVKYPELRFEVNNGITLCEPCHSLTDNYRGRG